MKGPDFARPSTAAPEFGRSVAVSCNWRSAGLAAIACFLLPGCTVETASDDATTSSQADTTSSQTSTMTDDASTGVDDSLPVDREAAISRISLAIRGVRPEPAELEKLAQSDASMYDIALQMLASGDLAAFLSDLHNEALFVEISGVAAPAGFAGPPELSELSLLGLNQEIVQSPLRLINEIVVTDRPYYEIVTANYLLATPSTAKIWGLELDAASADADGWAHAKPPAGVPASGILADPWLWSRHSTTLVNHNRGRANTLARALLCSDYSERHVEIDASIDLFDENQVAHAIAENPACVSCHQTLDPLAAHLGAFFPHAPGSLIAQYPVEYYVPAFSDLLISAPPGYYGQASDGFEDLGELIAADPRFSRCTVARFYAYLHQIKLEDVPLDRLAKLQASFLEHWNAKRLIAEIVGSLDFLPREGEADASRLMMRPWQLAREITAQTGFDWQRDLELDFDGRRLGPFDVLSEPFFGLKTLGGGVDGLFSTAPTLTATATYLLTARSLATRAAAQALSDPEATTLLGGLDLSTNDPTQLANTLAQLATRGFGRTVAANDPAVESLTSLHTALVPAGHPQPFEAIVVALLQDPDFLYY